MPRVQIDLIGAPATRQRLARTRQILSEIDLKGIAEYTRSVAYSLAPKDTGKGARDIEVRMHGLMAEVVSPDLHMYIMEYGRRAGSQQPSTNVLVGWGSRHGFVGRKALFALAIMIGRRGIRPHRFMAKAAEAARIKVSALARTVTVKINREW